MNKKEIVEALMQRRAVFLRRGGIEDTEFEHDHAALSAMVTDCLNKGWSSLDIMTYGSASEHVDPFLDEGTAIARMAKIAEKYH